jgi:subtilisin family serine protease
MVSFKTTQPATLAAKVKAMGGTIDRTLPAINAIVVSGIGTANAATLKKLGGIEYVAQDFDAQFLPPPSGKMTVQSISNPGPKAAGTDQSGAFFFPYQWNMRQVAADLAWSSTPGGAGELVCVLDTGVDPDHLDLAGKVDPTKLVSFISSPLFPGDLDPLDYNFHGTATSAYISSNGIGVASVAPDARLCSAKVLNVLGSGSFADVITGILWAAESGADVINMSLGAYVDKSIPGVDLLVAFQQRAVDFAIRKGAVVVASAGNSAIDLDHDPKTFISVPAQLKGVISVGATAPFNQANFDLLASYSNFGGETGISLVAPGGDFAAGNVLDANLTACSQYQLTLPFACGFASYLFVSGTSEAAPHVAGAAAVVESQRGQSLPASTAGCITRNADAVGPRIIFGAGRLNVANAAACTK